MPKLLIKGKNMFYEIHGEGEPIVILNGIMMSTASWMPFIDAFSKNNKLILIDFVDQGKSDKMEVQYTQDFHVEMLNELFDRLNIEKVHLVGISYGGEVAQRFALKYEHRLLSLILSNTTSYTNRMLKDIGEGWIKAAETYDGSTFFKATMPYIYSRKFYEDNIHWLTEREKSFGVSLKQEWYDGFVRLVRSAEDLNITDELSKIKVPTFIIGAEYDATTPVKNQEKIQKRIENSKLIMIKDSGHAAMYEKPYEFAAAVLGFTRIYDKKFKIL
ncbi:alpha/beta hydrolase [Sedimentibacter hydroxybenzoicus DSM 7310]|uniref:Alpha/beta hydrolase n=1 Tax=Sedimentibacter hydroxybenzoicus DSM 7310 TaxID=1123245 RepID=A0A974GY04_SEDHY|nr:alpha/beta hydrolase [Sedimentibacter hydroxybenzoicus]NYB75696.1 alpha/beta hydrolase [Sedimentibacter hydroxybenzoicus DSM 7310]